MCELISFIRIDVIILIQWLIVYALYIKFGKGSLPSLRAFMMSIGWFDFSKRLKQAKDHFWFALYTGLSLLYFIVNTNANTHLSCY